MSNVSETVVLSVPMPSSEVTEPQWCRFTAEGKPLSLTPTTGWPNNQQTAQAKLIVLVPGQGVSQLSAHLPKGSKKQLQQAAPFAVEEQLSSSSEQQHAVLDQVSSEGKTRIGMVHADLVQDWLNQCHQQQLKPDAIVPEWAALPLPESADTSDPSWHVWIAQHDDQTAWVKNPDGVAIATEIEALPTFLHMVVTPEDPLGLVLHGDHPAIETWVADTALTDLFTDIEHHQERSQQTAWMQLASRAAKQPQFNLLQGMFAQSHRRFAALALWKPTFIAAAALALLGLFTFGLQQAKWQQQQQALDDNILKTFQQGFPEAQSSTDPIRQAKQWAQAQANGQASVTTPVFLQLFNLFSVASADIPALDLASMDFSQDTLLLTLAAAKADDIETIQKAIATQTIDGDTLQVDIRGLKNENGRVRADIKIQRVKGAST